MVSKRAIIRRMVASAVVVGALAAGTVGLAGPAFAAPSSGGATASQAHPQLCSAAQHRKVRGRKLVNEYSKRVAATKKQEARAQAAGHTARATHLAKLAAREQAILARAEKRYGLNQASVAKLAARKCAPPRSTSSK